MERIVLVCGSNEWVVSGEGADAVWGDVRRTGEVTSRGEPLAALTFALRGDVDALQAAFNSLTSFGDRVGEAGGWLHVTPEGSVEVWRTPVYAASVALLGTPVGDRLAGCLGVRLVMRRAAWWEGTERSLPLTNLHGTGVVDGLRVDNHSDDLHSNVVDVAAGDALGGLPAPVSVELLPEPAVPGVVGSLALGWRRGDAAADFDHVLEGEDAATSLTTSVVTASDASGGAYRTVTWTSTAEQVLLEWTLTSPQLLAAGGRAFRPLLRLASGWLGGELWLRLTLASALSGQPLLWQSPEALLEVGTAVTALTPFALPPWLPDDPPAPMTLALRAIAPGGGSQTLGVDMLHLFPLDDGLRVEIPAALPNGSSVVIDADGTAMAALPTGKLAMPTVDGGPLMLAPGEAHRLYVMQGSGDLPGVGAALRVCLRYQPRVAEV